MDPLIMTFSSKTIDNHVDYNPNSFVVNAACLEGVNPFEFKDVPIFDGINHPHDKK